ncbi:MAG: VWA domain-containing protein [Methylophilus methylotrophus]|jgi:mxaC protein|uniref:VWA domain-containing protein n=1 Tax=Methylophilus methylotrophus TaxID=17 RepID=A0A5C7WPC9_METME|nr:MULTISPECIES: vWA domain-containing protein [Methylophilus]PPD13468.1 MAG: VWA domain-containing protein [Methylophilus sp.]TXI38723.1 MAG: VWA domain-containing protein [Methylophilus methylotrophus]
MAFNHPWLLWAIPLALLPLLLERSHSKHYSWIGLLPPDPLSSLIGLLLKILAALSILFVILGLAGPHTLEQQVQRTGIGAQIGLVLDRSASMDDQFVGDKDGHIGETKSVAAARIITNFIQSRKNDMMGVITFSNSAMYVLPLTENKEAVLSAVQATAGNSLFQTNIGGGLTSAVELFKNVPDSGSRAIILISDGAGRVSDMVQQKLRDWLQRYNIGLYWIVLRQPGGITIFDPKYTESGYDGNMPTEVILYQYFQTLRTPFNAYEASDPKSLEAAIADINSKEKKPIQYMEKIPGHDYTNVCYWIAIIMIAILLAVKYLEINTWRSA